MASIKDTVKHALLEYPTLFSCGAEVLHQLFFVIGNGMEWEGGELVAWEPLKLPIDVEEISKRNRAELVAKIYEFKKLGITRDIGTLREIHNYDFVVANIDALVEEIEIVRIDFGAPRLYPLCTKYARAFNVPDDIQPDWLMTLYRYVESVQMRLRMQQGDLTPQQQEYVQPLAELHKKLDDMCVARGLIATKQERQELTDKIIREIKENR